MDYKDFKDGQKVNVFIPAMNNFYNMEISDYDGKGAFLISNYGCKKRNKIGGHEAAFVLKDQNDVENFFYIHKGALKNSELEEVTKKAEEQYKRNNKSWIFN